MKNLSWALPHRLQVAAAARGMLAALDEAAARRDDKLDLFRDGDRFPDVFARKRELDAAHAAIAGLLPSLRKHVRWLWSIKCHTA